MDIPYNKEKYRFEVWDTAGQDQFHSVNEITYRNAKVFFIFIVCNQPQDSTTTVERYDEELEFT